MCRRVNDTATAPPLRAASYLSAKDAYRPATSSASYSVADDVKASTLSMPTTTGGSKAMPDALANGFGGAQHIDDDVIDAPH